VELDAISQPELEQIQRIGSTDLVVGIFDLDHGEQNGNALAMTHEALAEWPQPLRVTVISNNGSHAPPPPGPEGATDNPSSTVSYFSLPLSGASETPQQSISNAYRKVFAVGGKLGARACGVIASPSGSLTQQWIYRLVQPVLDLGFDLVAPCYSRQKMEGLLNRSILSPLHRALYGQRLQNPMGPDFGLSGRLLQSVVGRNSTRAADRNTVASIASAAASGNFQVCEAHLGARAQRPTDWGNLSSLLAEVLGAAFLEMEGRAAHWQNLRGSKTLPSFGRSEVSPPDVGTVDVHNLIESFQLGAKNLQDVWGIVLPPTTLLELRRLSRLPEDRFRLSDSMWAKIVYDFALGHRLRTISRDHLLKSVTPLYLGWIASYALEVQTAGAAEVESRIERLCQAYEDNKPYLVSRWRWPDRFNP
jgi:hypothetical protein